MDFVLRSLPLVVAVAGILAIYGYSVYRSMQLGAAGNGFLKLVSQAFIFMALIGLDAAMFWFLVGGLLDGALSPEVSAILGAIVTAITGAIGLAAKDFFNEHEDNGA